MFFVTFVFSNAADAKDVLRSHSATAAAAAVASVASGDEVRVRLREAKRPLRIIPKNNQLQPRSSDRYTSIPKHEYTF